MSVSILIISIIVSIPGRGVSVSTQTVKFEGAGANSRCESAAKKINQAFCVVVQ